MVVVRLFLYTRRNMEEFNQGKLDTLVNIFSEMMKNKEFAMLLKQKEKQEHEEKLEFTEKEINKMPSEFKRIFIHDKFRAKIYKRKTKTNMEELIKLLQEEKEKGSEVMALTLVIKRDYRLYAVSCNSSNEMAYQELL